MPSYSPLPAPEGGFLSGSGLPSLETGLTVRKEGQQEVHTKLPDRLLRAYEQIKQGVFISESKLWPGRRCLRLSQGVNAGEVLFYGGLPDESSGWSGRRPSVPDSGEDFKFIWRQEFTRAKDDRVTQRRYPSGGTWWGMLKGACGRICFCQCMDSPEPTSKHASISLKAPTENLSHSLRRLQFQRLSKNWYWIVVSSLSRTALTSTGWRRVRNASEAI